MCVLRAFQRVASFLVAGSPARRSVWSVLEKGAGSFMTKTYRSPALPQWSTSSRILAMATTWFFQPSLTLGEADRLTICGRKPKKKKKKRRKS